jgi:hypothetical protein
MAGCRAQLAASWRKVTPLAVTRRYNPVPRNILRQTPDFEDGVVGNWTSATANIAVANDATMAHGGTSSLRLTRTSGAGVIQVFSNTQPQAPQNPPVVPGETILRSGWIRHDAVDARAFRIRARYNLGNAGLVDLVGPDVMIQPNAWTLLSYTDTVPPNTDRATWAMATATNAPIGTNVWLDDVTMFASGRPAAAALTAPWCQPSVAAQLAPESAPVPMVHHHVSVSAV